MLRALLLLACFANLASADAHEGDRFTPGDDPFSHDGSHHRERLELSVPTQAVAEADTERLGLSSPLQDFRLASIGDAGQLLETVSVDRFGAWDFTGGELEPEDRLIQLLGGPQGVTGSVIETGYSGGDCVDEPTPPLGAAASEPVSAVLLRTLRRDASDVPSHYTAEKTGGDNRPSPGQHPFFAKPSMLTPSASP